MELAASRSRFVDLYDFAPVGYCTLNEEGLVLEANLACAALLNETRNALIKKPIYHFIYKEDQDVYYLQRRKLFETDIQQSFELRMIKKDDRIFWARLNTTLSHDSEGRPLQLIVLSDITEHKQVLRELQETQSQYLHAEKLSAIGKLSASIAHEFNNPLQCLIPILQGFKRWQNLEEKDRELLNLAISESYRMKDLIRNLQDFNKPSSDKKTYIDVHATLNSLLLLCKSDFKHKGISTVLNYAERVPQILAVPDQVKQVFLNLLNNAADACLHGGVITISTWQVKQRVAVAIQDNGIGIEPEKMDQIFQPFYTTKSSVKGTGLGLSVCHGIIQNHQGEIRAVSQPGKGSTFTVLLPIHEE